MNKVMAYKLVADSVYNELSAAVAEKLTDGWQPYGSAYIDLDGTHYQAMVRYEGTEDNDTHLRDLYWMGKREITRLKTEAHDLQERITELEDIIDGAEE